MGSLKSAGLSLLLVAFLLYVADSYTNIDLSNSCEGCMLRRNNIFLKQRQIYQCMGCCFSRAFPTTLKALETMIVKKYITSESTCCVANRSHQVLVGGITINNHTDCHCSDCRYHTI